MELKNCTLENTKKFSLSDYNCNGKILKIHDGDTVTCVLPIHDTFYQLVIRLNGIDTCEITSKNELLQKHAENAKTELTNLINSGIVKVSCHQFDKYGRLLADVSINGVNISTYMIENKLAYQYTGKTKKTDEELIMFFKLKE